MFREGSNLKVHPVKRAFLQEKQPLIGPWGASTFLERCRVGAVEATDMDSQSVKGGQLPALSCGLRRWQNCEAAKLLLCLFCHRFMAC